jgi:hypothetical protein
MSYVLNVFCLCKLYIRLFVYTIDTDKRHLKHMTCIYNLHRQKTYIQFTQKKDVYTIYTDKRRIYNLHRQKTFKTYDMYIQFTQTKDI